MKILVDLKKAFGHIGYIDAPHKYYDLRTRKQLISVTTLIKKFQSDFDEDYWAEYKAKEYGITKELVKEYWEKLRGIGSGKGSIVHDHLENRWFGKVFEIDYRKYIPPIPTLDFLELDKRQEKLIDMSNRFVKDHPNLIPIRTELIVGNDKIAGQIDFFGYDLDSQEFVLIDYKTDKQITYGNDFQVFKSFLMHLDDCKINKYSLQIKLYEKLLMPVTGEIKTKYIVWFNADNPTYEKIPIKELNDEANALLGSL